MALLLGAESVKIDIYEYMWFYHRKLPLTRQH